MGLEVREVGPIETPRHEDMVYLPATTVPPTVVALRSKRAPAVARAQFPRMGIDQAVPWVSILVVDIFPPNILGQSIFALLVSGREYWYMEYPRMWVRDAHSSHIILMPGYFAKWGTTFVEI